MSPGFAGSYRSSEAVSRPFALPRRSLGSCARQLALRRQRPERLKVPAAANTFMIAPRRVHVPNLAKLLALRKNSKRFDGNEVANDLDAHGRLLNSSSSALASLRSGGVEALGEPAVDVREHRAPLVAAVGVTEESREAGRSTQLQGSGFDLAG